MPDSTTEPTQEEFQDRLGDLMVACFDAGRVAFESVSDEYEDAAQREASHTFDRLALAARAFTEMVDRLAPEDQPDDWTPLHHIEPASGELVPEPGTTPAAIVVEPLSSDAGPQGCHGVVRVFNRGASSTAATASYCPFVPLPGTDFCEVCTPAPADYVTPPEPEPAYPRTLAPVDLEHGVFFTDTKMIIAQTESAGWVTEQNG